MTKSISWEEIVLITPYSISRASLTVGFNTFLQRAAILSKLVQTHISTGDSGEMESSWETELLEHQHSFSLRYWVWMCGVDVTAVSYPASHICNSDKLLKLPYALILLKGELSLIWQLLSLNCQEVVSGPFLMEARCLGPVGIKSFNHNWIFLINTVQVDST